MQTLRASKCGLSTAQLPSYILDVIDALTKAGYEAYIVGGGVRDMMLGLNPKDFDAVTNATPSQVKKFSDDVAVLSDAVLSWLMSIQVVSWLKWQLSVHRRRKKSPLRKA